MLLLDAISSLRDIPAQNSNAMPLTLLPAADHFTRSNCEGYPMRGADWITPTPISMLDDSRSLYANVR